jgi:hypothetical protein
MTASCHRDLPAQAFTYAHNHLWLARDLGPGLGEALQEETFYAWTLADTSVAEERLSEFDRGGKIYSGDLDRAICGEAATAMARRQRSVWLVPDSLARPGDPFLTSVQTSYFAVGDAVYYWERSTEVRRLMQTWARGASAAGQIAIVTPTHIDWGAVREPELDVAAEQATLVVVSAYDGDGAIIFTRK